MDWKCPMGRPGILKRPQINVGPLNVLIESLHDLHLQVGRPSLSKISAKSGKKTDDGYPVSYTHLTLPTICSV